VATLFPEEGPAEEPEAKPTVETLFGPEDASKADQENLSADQVFGDTTPAQRQEPSGDTPHERPES
jgi:hypothetical protein